jgi:hypothetical protein
MGHGTRDTGPKSQFAVEVTSGVPGSEAMSCRRETGPQGARNSSALSVGLEPGRIGRARWAQDEFRADGGARFDPSTALRVVLSLSKDEPRDWHPDVTSTAN